MTVGLALVLLLDPLKSSGLQGNFKLTGGRVLWSYGAESEHRNQQIGSPEIFIASAITGSLRKVTHAHTHTMAAMDVLRLFGCCRLIRGKQHVTMTCRVKKNLQDPAESHVSVDMMVGRMFVE